MRNAFEMPQRPGRDRDFTSWAAAFAWLTARGSSWTGIATVRNATTRSVVMRLGWVGASITVIGDVDFAAVTATPCGAVASVAGAVVTVTAPHTLATLAKVLRVKIVTDGTWSDVASGQWSVSGNDVTVPAATAAAIAAALGAGKVVRLWVEGVSELCIGASPCAVQPAAGFVAYFTGAGMAQIVAGAAARCALPGPAGQGMRIYHAAPTVGAAAGDRVTWGLISGAVYAFGGYGEDLAGDARCLMVRSAGANVYSSSTPIVYADQTGVDILIGQNTAALVAVGTVAAHAVALGTSASSVGRIAPAGAVAYAEHQAASVVVTRMVVA